ncbi:chemotaxis protein CheX [Simplicispira lacusdiani]|uniref:chemotaxis protein CheX n=1 Tax=Simplicispira lacusdiani TaxID=2213010 RepID=UPI000E7101BC|nr:chemotaxis protein CheX [Simplicispira lacusdiani]
MSGNRLQVEDVKVFSDAALGFFAQTTGHQAAVRTAYLLDGAEPMVWNDFQGRIELAGRYRGSVTFSAPRGLLTHVLLSIGESDYTDASHRDIVGEIANQMSGQARRHFGDALDISPPRVLSPDDAAMPPASGAAPFVIPMLWDRYEAHLVVQMERELGTPP